MLGPSSCRTLTFGHRHLVSSRCRSSIGKQAALSTATATCPTPTPTPTPEQEHEHEHEHELQLTLALIKPSVCAYQPDVSAVLKEIKRSNLQMVRSKRLFWKAQDAHQFYAEHHGKFYYDRLVIGMTRYVSLAPSLPIVPPFLLFSLFSPPLSYSGPSIALVLAGPDAIKQWRAMLGPTKAYRAKWQHPDCLRARFGLGDTRNGFHGSDSPESARREIAQVFEGWDTNWWIARETGRLPIDQGGNAKS